MTMPSNKWEEAVIRVFEEYYHSSSSNRLGTAKAALTNAVKELVEENYPKLDQAEVPDSMEEYHRSVKLLNTYQANLLKALDSKQNQSDLTCDEEM